MRIHSRLASVALLLPLLAAMGCSDNTVIAPGNGHLSAELVLDPAVGPRDASKPPFLWARADVSSVTFNANDPAWKISLGPFPLRIVGQTTEANLAIEDTQVLGTITITDGTYKLEKVFISKFELNTANEPPIPGVARCANGAPEFAELLISGNSSDERGIVPSNQPVFEVRSDTPRVLLLTMDGAALTAVLESHIICTPGSTSATVTPLLSSELSSLITVQSQ